MTTKPKPYPRHCAMCQGDRVERLILPSYPLEIRHNGVLHTITITITDLPVDRCQECGEVFFTNDSDDRIENQVRKVSP
ncbi:MAG TPA: YgiT-type zinc finger protein [Thermoguttaceae bacterium]|nr:YgiT-type zinc finger protein [Thermoguttaceae bacterium]